MPFRMYIMWKVFKVIITSTVLKKHKYSAKACNKPYSFVLIMKLIVIVVLAVVGYTYG